MPFDEVDAHWVLVLIYADEKYVAIIAWLHESLQVKW